MGSAKPQPPMIDRLPPHSNEAEQGVLGCILLSPAECLAGCIEKLRCGSQAFYDLRHQDLYDALLAMYDARIPIDFITLVQFLKDRNELEGIGGLAYLAPLPDTVPSAANLHYYLDIVREKYALRRVVKTCTETVARVYEHQGEVDELLDAIERDMLKVTQEFIESAETPSIKALVNGAIGRIEQMHQNQGRLSGLATGFPDLDKLTQGLQDGDMIVIAARPSVGKTSMCMQIAEHVAIEQKLPVGVFSLEMTAESLTLRMLCSRARVNLREVQSGFLLERDFPRLTGAAAKISPAPLYIDDASGLSILQLRAKARRMHQQHGIKLLVIDYLQLMHSTNRRAENRQQEIADISGGVKSLAKELKIPVIVLSQLNREIERDKNRKPRLSDLRESGSIEQDSDLVCLLYRAADGEPETEEEANNIPVNLLVAKQRNGPTGEINLLFEKPFTRFQSLARHKIDAADIPHETPSFFA